MVVLAIILFIVFLPELVSGFIGISSLILALICGIFEAIFSIFK